MANPQIDPEIIATIKSAKALSGFSHYIKSLDNTLTLADATLLAAAVIDSLPNLFESNPDLLDVVKIVIAEGKAEASKSDESE